MSTTVESTADRVESNREPPELDEDQIYHLLQNERRRNVLRYLRDAEGTVEMRDLAEQVAAWENDTTVQALSSNERQRVYIPLYQSHLPKLDEEGVIDYDQSRGTVEKTELVDLLYGYLEPTAVESETDDDDGTRWGRYYLGASGVGATMVAGTTFGLLSFIPPALVGGLILAMFWSLTVGQRLA